MRNEGRNKLYHWFFIFALLIPLLGCGKGEHGASDALSVSLEVPPGEAELFWYGVTSRSLVVVHDGKAIHETAWQPGQKLDCDLEEGDELIFTAFDRHGYHVVKGSARIGKEKKVSIPLQRLL